LRSSAHAADSAASQGSRISAQFHADVTYLAGALRHHRPAVVLAAVLLVAAWVGARQLRRYYGRRWIGKHLVLTVVPAPATDFTLHRAARRGLARRARAREAAEVRVIRVELASRTTSSTCTELAT
jgi:hypothetical protein